MIGSPSSRWLAVIAPGVGLLPVATAQLAEMILILPVTYLGMAWLVGRLVVAK